MQIPKKTSSGRFREQEWAPITAVTICLDGYGYQPLAALHRARQLLETIDHFAIAEKDVPEAQALRDLPQPIGAIVEFLGNWPVMDDRATCEHSIEPLLRPLEHNHWN